MPSFTLIFKLCLEPLFNAINCCNAEDDFNVTSQNNSVSFKALAYAKDIIYIWIEKRHGQHAQSIWVVLPIF